jgi:hypothetical protein
MLLCVRIKECAAAKTERIGNTQAVAKKLSAANLSRGPKRNENERIKGTS